MADQDKKNPFSDLANQIRQRQHGKPVTKTPPPPSAPRNYPPPGPPPKQAPDAAAKPTAPRSPQVPASAPPAAGRAPAAGRTPPPSPVARAANAPRQPQPQGRGPGRAPAPPGAAMPRPPAEAIPPQAKQPEVEATPAEPPAESPTGQAAGLSADQLFTMAKMGYTQWEYGKLDRAKAIFQTLVSARPNEPWFRCALGSVLQRQRQYAAALQQYNIALQLNPADIPSRVNRGEIMLKVGNREEAFSDLRHAIESDRSGKHPCAIRAKALLIAAQNQGSEKAPRRP